MNVLPIPDSPVAKPWLEFFEQKRASAQNQADPDHRLNATTLCVVLALLCFGDPWTGANIRPGHDRLMKLTGLVKSTVSEHIRRLIHHGLLLRVEGGRHLPAWQRVLTGRCRNAAVYALILPVVPGLPTTRTPIEVKEKDLPIAPAREGNLDPEPRITPQAPDFGRRPPRRGTVRFTQYMEAHQLKRAHGMVFAKARTSQLAHVIADVVRHGWTAEDIWLHVQKQPLPVMGVHSAAGFLAWRLEGAQDLPRPTVERAEVLARQKAERAAQRAVQALKAHREREGLVTADRLPAESEYARWRASRKPVTKPRILGRRSLIVRKA